MRYLVLLLAIALTIHACKDRDGDGARDVSAADQLVKDLSDRAAKYPDSIEYRVALVDALDSLGRYREALTNMNILLQKDSANNSLWARNALLLERSGDTTAAIRSYARSISIYPEISTQLYLANLFAERKNDTALLLVNNVATNNTDRQTLAECDFIAGVYHARKGNASLAEQLFDRCIGNDRKLMEAYIEKGLLHFDRKKYDDALKIFQAAASVEPTYADAFYYQARCYELTGKTQEAINLYQQALSLDPALQQATEALGRLGAQKS
ncbi:MAG: tetratricopeptide repeat protein [Chitinophagaceae bacterium]|nr:tetratricopeptide repeat protein [Chitinophagaceae bacterium]